MSFGFSFTAMRSGFLDRPAVMKAMNKKSLSAQRRMGAFVRRSAKSSLRYRKKASAPGSPPSVHRGAMSLTKTNRKGVTKTVGASPFRELLFFAYDSARKSTVVGQVVFRKSNRVIRVQEHGGDIDVTRLVFPSSSQRAKRERVTIKLPPRPTMKPALAANMKKFPELFRG